MKEGLGFLLAGIFVGVVGAEALRRKIPQKCFAKLHGKIREVTSVAKEGFVKGYKNAVAPPKPKKKAAAPA